MLSYSETVTTYLTLTHYMILFTLGQYAIANWRWFQSIIYRLNNYKLRLWNHNNFMIRIIAILSNFWLKLWNPVQLHVFNPTGSHALSSSTCFPFPPLWPAPAMLQPSSRNLIWPIAWPAVVTTGAVNMYFGKHMRLIIERWVTLGHVKMGAEAIWHTSICIV